ncbi:MAG TPA: hypothetical protein PKN33_20305 [Phycisphaerae bacterium]|nr:hypothetical protein [Phycisphaerales bacterium]HNO80396.1 hypothetical protein [Phycisphaerae bacterium]
MDQEQRSAESSESAEVATKEPRIDWNNPDTPAGDAPAMSSWPLVASVVVYSGWLVFLVVMAYMRVSTTPQ